MDVIDGQGDSQYDDDSRKGVIDNLVGGFVVILGTGQYLSGSDDFDAEGLEVWGTSGFKKDADTAGMTVACAFDSEKNAIEARGTIEQEMSNDEDLRDVKATVEGRIVKVTADADMDTLNEGTLS